MLHVLKLDLEGCLYIDFVSYFISLYETDCKIPFFIFVGKLPSGKVNIFLNASHIFSQVKVGWTRQPLHQMNVFEIYFIQIFISFLYWMCGWVSAVIHKIFFLKVFGSTSGIILLMSSSVRAIATSSHQALVPSI